jgi:3' exoribonuclease, RNase T-like
MDYILDLETLGTESTSIVLSIALLPITDDDANTAFIDLVDRALFWKLSVKHQYKLGRTADQKTLEWWNKQSQSAKAQSFRPYATDLDPIVALRDIQRIINPAEDTFWSRGCMDQLWLESLTRTYKLFEDDQEQIIPDHAHRDIRTMLLCQGKSVNHLSKPVEFIAHDPRHDCAMDAITLLSPAP